jgi:hypothetical protein
MHKAAALTLLAGSVILAGVTHAIADEDQQHGGQEDSPKVAQVVALDECDPQTFNPALGEEGTGFCHNVTLYGLGLGFETPLQTLINEANGGTPDPGWDFEPDQLTVDAPRSARASDRGSFAPDRRGSDVGFRCAQ